MSPEEKAVIEAAVKLYHEGQNDHWTACAVVVAVEGMLKTQGPDHSPGSADVLGVYCDDPKHCPPTDSCRCSRTERVYCHVEDCHGGADVQEWVPATLVQCLAGDRIRIGQDETDVIRTDGGRGWHADNADPYRPKPWKHVELRMELTANPGLREYPPNTPCEILATPERKAVLLLQSAFPGSAVTSSDVD